MPDVICHGGGELSESTHGEGGADGQRPEKHTPEVKDTSAEELSSKNISESGAPAARGGETESPDDADEAQGGTGEQPEPEFISPITFKTSGTFFRERVAQTLAEQGYDDPDLMEGSSSAGTGEDGSDRSPSSPGGGTAHAVDASGEDAPETDDAVDAGEAPTSRDVRTVSSEAAQEDAEEGPTPRTEAFPVPQDADPAAVETLLVNGITAWQMLHRTAAVPHGGTVVVLGANGGVGTTLLQLARHSGITVIGTAARRHDEAERELGAT
ncbi:hypothetical protein Q7689_22175, partial [Nocardiopsis tropica]|nr:hypothetical protein [Nocardiopsis tropica]